MPDRSPLLQRLRIEHPVIQAPLAGGGDTPALVAAVSNAGGMGFIGAAYSTPEQIVALARSVRAQTSRPFGINLFAPLPAPDSAINLEAVLCGAWFASAHSTRTSTGVLCGTVRGRARRAPLRQFHVRDSAGGHHRSHQSTRHAAPWHRDDGGRGNRRGESYRAAFLSLWAGQGVRMARRQSAAALMAQLVQETFAAIKRLQCASTRASGVRPV